MPGQGTPTEGSAPHGMLCQALQRYISEELGWNRPLPNDLMGVTYSLHCSSCFGVTNFVLRILKGNPKKELQWRL